MSGEKFKVLIVEDIFEAQEVLKNFVDTREELVLAGIAADGNEALQKLLTETYNLVLIDINLPYLSGIEVLDELNKQKKIHFHIIFTTAYDQHAIKAFELGAIDYLLKPLSLERFHQAIDAFLVRAKGTTPFPYTLEEQCLFFKERRKQRLVAFDDIIYLSSHGKNTVIHTKSDAFEAFSILKEMECKLPQPLFLRIHKQYIINTRFLRGIECNSVSHSQYIVTLNDEDDTPLPVGRDYAPVLKKRLGM